MAGFTYGACAATFRRTAVTRFWDTHQLTRTSTRVSLRVRCAPTDTHIVGTSSTKRHACVIHSRVRSSTEPCARKNHMLLPAAPQAVQQKRGTGLPERLERFGPFSAQTHSLQGVQPRRAPRSGNADAPAADKGAAPNVTPQAPRPLPHSPKHESAVP